MRRPKKQNNSPVSELRKVVVGWWASLSVVKKRIAIVSPLVCAAFAFLGFVYDFAEPICKYTPLETTCGSNGWGGVASPREQAAWDRLSKQQPACSELAQFREKFPNGVYADRVARAYSLPIGERVEIRIEAHSTAFEHSFYEGNLSSGRATAPTEREAQAIVDARALVRVKQSCQRATDISQGVLVSSSLNDKQWSCTDVVGGVSCSVKAIAVCNIRQGDEKTVKVCGKP
jgi:hypothetical protein